MADDAPPSERELDILKVLWEVGSGSVREVHDHLPAGLELAFNTVQTVLRNMEDKGLVGHRADGRTFVYFPTHTREQVTSRFLTKVFGGALDQFVLSMLQAADAAPAELRELERLIAQARAAKQTARGGGDMAWERSPPTGWPSAALGGSVVLAAAAWPSACCRQPADRVRVIEPGPGRGRRPPLAGPRPRPAAAVGRRAAGRPGGRRSRAGSAGAASLDGLSVGGRDGCPAGRCPARHAGGRAGRIAGRDRPGGGRSDRGSGSGHRGDPGRAGVVGRAGRAGRLRAAHGGLPVAGRCSGCGGWPCCGESARPPPPEAVALLREIAGPTAVASACWSATGSTPR